jgi:uncharacterized protein (UPF0333 family)
MDKLKLAFTFTIILGVIASGLYWISKNAEKSKSDTNEAMSHGYTYSKGIITVMHSYKGRTLEVKYQIDGVEYNCTRGWDNNPRNIGVGDSISFRFAIKNPNFIITELEDDY